MELPLAVLTATSQETNHQQQSPTWGHAAELSKEEAEAGYYDCQEPTTPVQDYYDCYYDCEQPPASWLSWEQKQAKR